MSTQQQSSSIHEILQLFKYLKSTSSQKQTITIKNVHQDRDVSTLSFSSKNFQSGNRNALDSIFTDNYMSNRGNGNANTNQSNPQKPNLNILNPNMSKQNRFNPQAHVHPQPPHHKTPKAPDIFTKLYQQSKQSQLRKCILQYQTRRSVQQKQASQCTFSPNIKSRLRQPNINPNPNPNQNPSQQYRHRFHTEHQQNENLNLHLRYGSIENNQSFYLKNLEWMERKDKSIKKMQIQRNQEKVNMFTFTPKINKNPGKRTARDKQMGKTYQNENSHIVRGFLVGGSISKSKSRSKQKENKMDKHRTVKNFKGVNQYLQRQQKAKKNAQYVKNRFNFPHHRQSQNPSIPTHNLVKSFQISHIK